MQVRVSWLSSYIMWFDAFSESSCAGEFSRVIVAEEESLFFQEWANDITADTIKYVGYDADWIFFFFKYSTLTVISPACCGSRDIHSYTGQHFLCHSHIALELGFNSVLSPSVTTSEIWGKHVTKAWRNTVPISG